MHIIAGDQTQNLRQKPNYNYTIIIIYLWGSKEIPWAAFALILPQLHLLAVSDVGFRWNCIGFVEFELNPYTRSRAVASAVCLECTQSAQLWALWCLECTHVVSCPLGWSMLASIAWSRLLLCRSWSWLVVRSSCLCVVVQLSTPGVRRVAFVGSSLCVDLLLSCVGIQNSVQTNVCVMEHVHIYIYIYIDIYGRRTCFMAKEHALWPGHVL